MPNLLTPSESKAIADRFRKLLESDENKDLNLIIEESILEQEDNDQLREEHNPDEAEVTTPITPDITKPSIIPGEIVQEENGNIQNFNTTNSRPSAYRITNISKQSGIDVQPSSESHCD